ncbi:MAG: Hsp20/alpha crystallin family protein [Dehalococcoidia bacterium]
MTQRTSDIFSEFDRIRERMAEAWRQVLGPPGAPRYCAPIIEPYTDVYETKDKVVVVMELAGIADEELEIIVDGRNLIIHGQRPALQGEPNRLYSQMEICCGPFERNLFLPADVDPDGIKASYQNGFFEIALPKVKRQISRQVRVVARQ